VALHLGAEHQFGLKFRDDFEFNDEAGPSHLGHGAPATALPASPLVSEIVWSQEAQAELSKIPFFVRGKARRNTEQFATTRGLALIHLETLYDARSHFSR
jgi:light-independent protochlorophyllide reductase subunit B